MDLTILLLKLLFVILFFCGVIIYKKIICIYYVKNYTDFITVLNFNLEKAYEIIYKDRILIYSVEAIKISDKDFNIITQDFARLVIKFLGNRMYKELLYFYGSNDTLMLTIVEYFNNRYENDEIRKRAMDELTESETQNEG